MKASRWFWAVPLVVAPLAGAISAACIGTAKEVTKDGGGLVTAETGPADTGPADTGPADTGPADTGPADTGPKRCNAADPFTVNEVLFLSGGIQNVRGGRKFPNIGTTYWTDGTDSFSAVPTLMLKADGYQPFTPVVGPPSDAGRVGLGAIEVLPSPDNRAVVVVGGAFRRELYVATFAVANGVGAVTFAPANRVSSDFASDQNSPQFTGDGLLFDELAHANGLSINRLVFLPGLLTTHEVGAKKAYFETDEINRASPYRAPSGNLYFTEIDPIDTTQPVGAAPHVPARMVRAIKVLPAGFPDKEENVIALQIRPPSDPDAGPSSDAGVEPWQGSLDWVSEDECEIYYTAGEPWEGMKKTSVYHATRPHPL